MAGLEYENGKWIPNWAWEKDAEFLEWLSSSGVVFPAPRYKVGDTISFNWRSTHAKNGEVRVIKLVFDHKYEREWKNLTEYDNIIYDVYWNGHSRWVKLENIIENGAG